MKKHGKFLIAALLCLLPVLLVSCVEDEQDVIDNLCEGYWQTRSGTDKPLMSFDASGSICYFEYHYEASEGTFFVCPNDNTDRYTRYMIDVKNSTICFLSDDTMCDVPEKWYDIYVLTDEMAVFGTPDEGEDNIRIEKLSNVTLLSKDEFCARYPKSVIDSAPSVFE